MTVMFRRTLAALAVCVLAGASSSETATRFVPLDIFLDSPQPVAAWQFELQDRNAAMKVVGVESGDSEAFRPAPYYDREAVAGGEADRIVVADYSLAEEGKLPSGRVRVATVHLMLDGNADFELTLVTANAADGRLIEEATVSLLETQTRER